MRKTIIAGNWKLNKTIHESIDFTNSLKRRLCDIEDIDIVICPTYVALDEVSDLLFQSNIKLGAQNSYPNDTGAFTGEVSSFMLKEIGVEYVIAGHSERRQFFAETDALINKKIKSNLKHNLNTIFCVGENISERENNLTFKILERQINEGLKDIDKGSLKAITIAYEPVWAIGTGKTATPDGAEEAHLFIRKSIEKIYDRESAQNLRILYGGSVKAENIAELLRQKDIDGALVGGASLDLESFVNIVNNARGVKNKC